MSRPRFVFRADMDRILQQARLLGLSQKELAHRAGIRPETVTRASRGRTLPSPETVRRLARVVGLSLEEVVLPPA